MNTNPQWVVTPRERNNTVRHNVETLLRKGTISFDMSVCLSVRPLSWNNSATTGRIFIKFGIIRKPVEKIHVSLTPDKNNGHFTRRHMAIYDITYFPEFILE